MCIRDRPTTWREGDDDDDDDDDTDNDTTLNNVIGIIEKLLV